MIMPPIINIAVRAVSVVSAIVMPPNSATVPRRIKMKAKFSFHI